MTFYEFVLQQPILIEKRLRNMGAQGKKFSDLTNDIEAKLGAELTSRIRNLAETRNKLAHEYGYRYAGDESTFIRFCESVLSELEVLEQSTGTGHKTSPKGREAMLQENMWVEITTVVKTGRSYQSFESTRLVFFERGRAKIMPPGYHRVWPLSGVNAIGLVKMSSGRFNIELREDAPTKDGLRVNLDLTVSMRVREDQNAISRVASNAGFEQEMVRDAIVKAARAAISAHTAQEIDANLNNIGDGILTNASHETARHDCAFQIGSVAVGKLHLSNDALRNHSEKIVTEAWEAEMLSLKKYKVQMESEIAQIPKLNDATTARVIAKEKNLDGLDLAKKHAKLFEHIHGFAALHPGLYADLEAKRIAAGSDSVKLAALQENVEAFMRMFSYNKFDFGGGDGGEKK